ncbi:AMP-binding protein [Terricaulis silvestris]|uniref:3-methylmercaptopropionyl-CoA ligase n=1 Tax=Terricaulis silvestris TaxID=2686094 RepID=A0A6I6MRM6_9CAUL|nr:AMP-binding protein [Terricaulis silvestris]QGZ93793.1 Long-chain-fatty-acid--CoA ligase FadD13 [Terricaulis silvestris]
MRTDRRRDAAADWPAHYGRTKPQAIALRNHESNETRTWAQLDKRVGKLAHVLRNDLGLKPGDRVVNLSNGDIRHFELQFACARAGLIWAPLNFRLTTTELAGLCEDLQPGLMVTDDAWSAAAREASKMADVPRTLTWGPNRELDEMVERAPVFAEHEEIDPEAPLLILFTSGTTGTPKAAVITVGGLVWQALNQAQFCGNAESGSHVFLPLPLFHAGGLNSQANPILYFGGQVTVAPRFDPDVVVKFAGDPANKVTHLGLVPIMYKMMSESPAFAGADFRCVRNLLVAGGRLPDALRETYAAKDVQFMSQYGGTETGPTITSLDGARVDKLRAGSCGQRAIHVQMRLVDETGNDVEQGEPGEVWVKGPAVIKRYYGRDPEKDFPEGWFHTGDVAWEDDEGFLYIVDRVKDMYKSGGENVYPAEVELVLASHPAVAEISVIGVSDEQWGEVGLAVAVARQGHTLTLESLCAVCEGRLARFKRPKHLVVVEELPRNVTGKVAKHMLREMFRGSRSA